MDTESKVREVVSEDSHAYPGAVEDEHSRLRSVRVEEGYIRNRKGCDVAFSVYRPRSGDYDNVVLIVPALAEGRRGYHEFANHLALNNVVVTFDPAGTGYSCLAGHVSKLRVADWVEDLEHLIRMLAEQFGKRIVCLGHGLGGELLGLASPAHVHKVVLIGSQRSYWRLWQRRHRLSTLTRWGYLYACARCGRRTRIPGLRTSRPVPPGVLLDLTRWATQEILVDGTGSSLEGRFALFNLPLLAIYAVDDARFAPAGACAALLSRFSNAGTEVWRLSSGDWSGEPIGRSGYFSQITGPRLWNSIDRWIAL